MTKPNSFRTAIYSIAVATAMLAASDNLYAQMIGNMRVGTRPGGQNQFPGTTVTPGANAQGAMPPAPGGIIQNNARFLRGNRTRNDFVGSNRTEMSGFVGSGQALGVGRVPTAAETFRLETRASMRGNKALPLQPATGMYYPRLDIGEGLDESNEVDENAEFELPAEIEQRLRKVAGDNIRASIVGRTAIVRGQVESERAAELAISLLNFEPGIDRVRSELRIVAK